LLIYLLTADRFPANMGREPVPMAASMRVDLHQHVWTVPLIESLAARDRLPRIDRAGGRLTLRCAGETPYQIDIAAQSPPRRAAALDADGLDQAVIALSSPIGIEALHRDAALGLIDAHLAGVDSLGDRFSGWGPLAVDRPQPGDVDRLLGRGCVGVSVPAGALDGAGALDALGPVLERIESHNAPLFVHPGPGRDAGTAEAGPGEPAWWPALTTYVAQMQAAWLAFAALGRPRHPGLVVVFSMLAGAAPLLSERLDTRGGPPVQVRDPGVFYDTSSYGPVAVEAIARRVGPEQLVYGSDRPVLEPLPTGRELALQENAAALLARTRARA
jgi:predicted TIM-barrel fold metal-dependent hydrolase